MKKLILALSCLAVPLVRPAASQDILALHPAYAERDATLQAAIEGTWSSDAFPKEILSFEKAGDNFYILRDNDNGRMSEFEAAFTRIGEFLLLDISPRISDAVGNWLFRKQVLSMHSLHRVNFGKDSLRIASLNYAWFYSNVVKKGSTVSHAFSGSDAVLTLPTADLRRFIEEHAQEHGFFEDDQLISRIGAPGPAKAPSIRAAGSPEVLKETAALQECTPAFPLKDGWLGGDGDISIPWPGGRSLWIFADTFVGERTRTSRSGANMISNSVAIAACGPAGEPTVQYFWRDQHGDNPKPIFESFTGRYRYWPCGAFMSGGDLYIPLLKIGPKPGAAPDDIFNFAGVGMSLVRVARPAETPPNEWKVELFPWSSTFDPNVWGCCVFNDGFLYFFEQGKNETVRLKRLHRDHFEAPVGHVEFFSAGRTWSTGDPGDSAISLFRGDIGSAANYHRDIKMWVMVCGPGFLNNKIRIRTAPALEGPWSDEKLVYECPESTPGSPIYDKDNFCYGGREHLQFYDPKTRSLLITYDCNSTSFGKLVSNLGIYSPKVLRIRLDR